MSRSSAALADSLAKRFRAIELNRSKIELLASRSLLPQSTATQFYEGLFLSAHVAFEGFLEELFVGLLLADVGLESIRSDVKPRITVRSHSVAREVLIGRGKQYIDWLPYKNTLELARIYFRGGRPFSDLGNPEKDHLTKCHTIRNVIAHASRDSINKFSDRVIGNTPLPPHERTPSGYLRGMFRTAPSQTRYENYISQLLVIARKLAK